MLVSEYTSSDESEYSEDEDCGEEMALSWCWHVNVSSTCHGRRLGLQRLSSTLIRYVSFHTAS